MSDISDLFSKDPLSLTKSDRSAIIVEYRDKRAKYMLGVKTPKAKPAPKAKAGGLSLEDLDDVAPTGATKLSLEDLD